VRVLVKLEAVDVEESTTLSIYFESLEPYLPTTISRVTAVSLGSLNEGIVTVVVVSELNWYNFFPLKLLKISGTLAVSLLVQPILIFIPNLS
jgi:hypothetical protein